MKYLEKWSTRYMKTPGNWARPETWLENTLLIFFSAPCKIQGIFFAKKVVGHNFWTEGPTDLRLTFLSCIFDGRFGDTPLDHIFHICPYAHKPVGQNDQVLQKKVFYGTPKVGSSFKLVYLWGLRACYFLSFSQYNPCYRQVGLFSLSSICMYYTLQGLCNQNNTMFIQKTKPGKHIKSNFCCHGFWRTKSKSFSELIHQVAMDMTVVVCAGYSDRIDPLRITQFVAP